jgi:hypothetical protein
MISMEKTSLDIHLMATQGAAGPTSWFVEVADFNSPFSGLFVFGPTLADARAALATAIWTSIVRAPERHRALGIDPDHIAELDLITITKKVVPVSSLQGQVST